MSKHEIEKYGDAYYSMVWFGAKGYPEQVNSGRCYMTGMLGMLRHFGEPDVLFADGDQRRRILIPLVSGVGRARIQWRQRPFP